MSTNDDPRNTAGKTAQEFQSARQYRSTLDGEQRMISTGSQRDTRSDDDKSRGGTASSPRQFKGAPETSKGQVVRRKK
jgi:hypothetical protein